MRRSGRSRKKVRGFMRYLFLLLVVYFATTVGSYFYLKDIFTYRQDQSEYTEQESHTNVVQEKTLNNGRLYGISGDVNEGLKVSARESMLVSAEDFIRGYLKRYKTSLIDLYLDSDGVIYLDIGNELRRNLHPDAGEELRFIAEMYRGLKQRIPHLRAIKILIDGREEETLLGHIDISHPLGGSIADVI